MPKTPIGCVLLVVKIAVVVAVLAAGYLLFRNWYDTTGSDKQSEIQKCQAATDDLAKKAACLTK